MLRFLRSRPSDLDDSTLLKRFQRSQRPEDLSPLYERYLELIYGQCLYYLRAPQKAEDATMEVFEHLLKKVPGQEIGNFRNWLQSVVRNFCLMQLRKEKRDPLKNSQELIVQSADYDHLFTEFKVAGEKSEAELQKLALADCLKELTAEQQLCLRRFYLEPGNSYKSIAEELTLDLGRVRSYIQNGRRNLRKCMEGD
jgi:RNA polymerase sigma-70 factor (ECF subfamily)